MLKERFRGVRMYSFHYYASKYTSGSYKALETDKTIEQIFSLRSWWRPNKRTNILQMQGHLVGNMLLLQF